jgi:hypothetical protein
VLHLSTDFSHPWDQGLAARHAKATAHPSWMAAALRFLRDALCEAVAAHRQYERLRFVGAPHDAAIRQALGISHDQK